MSQKLDLSIVVAMTPDRVIGRDNDLPWGTMPSDLSRFRKITQEVGVVILGRKTYDSIVARRGSPLPKRHHIVLTRAGNAASHPDVTFVSSVEAAAAEASRRGGRACVIGGAEVYDLFLPLVTRLFVTEIHAPIEGDTYFPPIGKEWRPSDGGSPISKWNELDAHASSFTEYVRR